ncbi:hypothetical protein HY640_00265 [Candidatus Woesearchaeota archaeon]|nr:hypothetical protein [Candidatus Woesearchaeota archaeon]
MDLDEIVEKVNWARGMDYFFESFLAGKQPNKIAIELTDKYSIADTRQPRLIALVCRALNAVEDVAKFKGSVGFTSDGYFTRYPDLFKYLTGVNPPEEWRARPHRFGAVLYLPESFLQTKVHLKEESVRGFTVERGLYWLPGYEVPASDRSNIRKYSFVVITWEDDRSDSKVKFYSEALGLSMKEYYDRFEVPRIERHEMRHSIEKMVLRNLSLQSEMVAELYATRIGIALYQLKRDIHRLRRLSELQPDKADELLVAKGALEKIDNEYLYMLQLMYWLKGAGISNSVMSYIVSDTPASRLQETLEGMFRYLKDKPEAFRLAH